MEQLSLVETPVLLDAHTRYTALVAEAERLGEEHAALKQTMQGYQATIRDLHIRQSRTINDAEMDSLGDSLTTSERLLSIAKARWQELQHHRRHGETVCMQVREQLGQLQQRAFAAIGHWREARTTAETAPEATARYQARIRQSTNRQLLENLVGVEEASAVFDHGEFRPWQQRF